MDNYIMMQYFEWELPADQQHWKRLLADAKHLAKIGVSGVWLPPCCKGTGSNDVGYGVYDLYDLGEFDQKGSVATKYGDLKTLIAAIDALHAAGLKVYADVVLNHKAGADATEEISVVEVDYNDRGKVISDPFMIEAWTRFEFPGRNDAYSRFKWRWEHFTATDFDQKTGRTAIYKIVGENKDFSEEVDEEFGNYDFLMYANIDYNHPDVVDETVRWGKWIAEKLKLDGMRMDGVKHIHDDFIERFVKEVREAVGRPFFVVGEYWKGEPRRLSEYLSDVNYHLTLFDVPLHFNLYKASRHGSAYDLRDMFTDTLVAHNPMNVVTFVDNHDSQHHQSLESFIEDWFKQIAYALILLRQDGYPCLFYGDYYGIGGKSFKPPLKDRLEPLLTARKKYAYGEQIDRFEQKNCIGWQRVGDHEHHGSGLVVVVSNEKENACHFSFGPTRAKTTWVDMTGNRQEEIILSEDGSADFFVAAGSVSVWVQKDALYK